MNKSDIPELHFICYIDNIPSMLDRGILCRNEIIRRNLHFRDVSEAGVQEIRANKRIPGISRRLHDYTNLYFDAHNPMLSRRRSENDEICVLKINKCILDLDGVIVTDQNAARECWFKPVDQGLPLLDREDVYRVNWKDRDDPINDYRQAGIKCAEVLIPGCVESRYIIGAYVANQTALEKFRTTCDLSATVKTNLFFFGGY